MPDGAKRRHRVAEQFLSAAVRLDDGGSIVATVDADDGERPEVLGWHGAFSETYVGLSDASRIIFTALRMRLPRPQSQRPMGA